MGRYFDEMMKRLDETPRIEPWQHLCGPCCSCPAQEALHKFKEKIQRQVGLLGTDPSHGSKP